jgi:hypothetical protein
MAASKIKLGTNERDKLFKREFTELKIKVALNWFELMVLMLISFSISFKLVYSYSWEYLFIPMIIATLISILITGVFSFFRKYQLNISRFDKEDIYKNISEKLIDESKKCN